MVAERVVLRRVEHLQQRRGRVAPVVRPDLVDLVEQDDRVHRTGLLDRPHDPAGERTDVRPAVAADLRLVPDAAQGDADELPTERARDRLTQRGLADSRRTREQDHRAGAAAADHLEPALGATAPDGEVLDDPLLDLVEAVVIGIEHGAGRDHVGGVLGRDAPGQLEHGVEPGPDPRGLRALVAGPLELVDLAQQRLAYGVGDVGGLDAAAVVVGPFGLALSELLADRGELLTQQELPLALLHALADVLTDLVGDLGLGEVVPRPADQGLEPRLHVGVLQQLPLAVDGEVRRVAGGVGDRARVGHLVDRVDDLPGLAPLEHGDDQPLVLLGELTGTIGDVVVDRLDLHPQGRTGPGDTRCRSGRGARPSERPRGCPR